MALRTDLCPLCHYESAWQIFGTPWHPACYERVRLRREADRSGAVITSVHLDAIVGSRPLPDARRFPTYASLAELS